MPVCRTFDLKIDCRNNFNFLHVCKGHYATVGFSKYVCMTQYSCHDTAFTENNHDYMYHGTKHIHITLDRLSYHLSDGYGLQRPVIDCESIVNRFLSHCSLIDQHICQNIDQ